MLYVICFQPRGICRKNLSRSLLTSIIYITCFTRPTRSFFVFFSFSNIQFLLVNTLSKKESIFWIHTCFQKKLFIDMDILIYLFGLTVGFNWKIIYLFIPYYKLQPNQNLRMGFGIVFNQTIVGSRILMQLRIM